MTTQITALNETLNQNGFSAKIWKNYRIYINGSDCDRSAKAYIQFDNPDATDSTGMENAVLKVFSNNYKCTPKWNVNRAKQIKHAIALKLQECGLIDEVCETWQEIIL